MKNQLSFWLAACLATGTWMTLRATQPADERVAEVFRKWSAPGTPGASVAVIEHGKLVCEKGYGLANLEYNIPVGPESIYHVASVSKQFTAMALVLLEQEGKLSLEDDVHKYLPELPDYGCKITIRHLLQHTSGIRDQWQLLVLAGWRMDDVITQDQILRLLFHQKELNFPAGTKHLYSNGGYTLAAEIAARVSGTPFPDFCEERIFRPLEMTHTHFHLDHHRIVPGRAYSYGESGSGYEALPLNYANVGATSLFTTAADLAKWLDNFRHARVGGKAAIEKLQTVGVLANGQKLDYALGISAGEYRGQKTLSHGGADAGYRSFVLWFPQQELGIAVLSGLASFDSEHVAHQVADLYLQGALTTNTPPANPSKTNAPKLVQLDSSVLGRYTGHYLLDRGMEADIITNEGKLYTRGPSQQPRELKPLGTNRFSVVELNGEIEFTIKSNGLFSVKYTSRGGVLNGEQISRQSDNPLNLASYAGVYWSDELETQYTLQVKGDWLYAIHSHHGEIPLTAWNRNGFSSPEWFMPNVNFLRDTNGNITGLTLGGGRVAAVKFQRK